MQHPHKVGLIFPMFLQMVRVALRGFRLAWAGRESSRGLSSKATRLFPGLPHLCVRPWPPSATGMDSATGVRAGCERERRSSKLPKLAVTWSGLLMHMPVPLLRRLAEGLPRA